MYGRRYCTIYGTINLTIHHYGGGRPPTVVDSTVVDGEIYGAIIWYHISYHTWHHKWYHKPIAHLSTSNALNIYIYNQYKIQEK